MNWQKIAIRPANANVEREFESLKRAGISAVIEYDLRKFIADLAIGKVNKGRQVSARTQVKYLSMLRLPLLKMNKPMGEITKSDLEYFDRALSTDQLLTRKSKPFAWNVKTGMRIALRVLLRWKIGKDQADRLTDFFDTRDILKTPDFLTESEVARLFKACDSARDRFLIAVLFDSGARAEEFFNIRYGDIQISEGKREYVRVELKKEYSKTQGRTISLYWRNSIEAVRDYLAERVRQGVIATEPIYASTYDAARQFLYRLGKRVLNRPLHFHLFRHASATYYAVKLNRQELCYRYGWRFSSNMVDLYISRAGMANKELDEKFTNTELGELKDELARKEQQDKIKEDKIQKLETTIETLQKNFAVISELLSRNPSVTDIERALKRKSQKDIKGV